MSIQDKLNKRLAYLGGNAEGRMQMGKLRSLKKALLYSYQAATAVLQDGRKFKCLMNPDKNKADYTTNTISIPYEDVCFDKKRQKVTFECNIIDIHFLHLVLLF